MSGAIEAKALAKAKAGIQRLRTTATYAAVGATSSYSKTTAKTTVIGNTYPVYVTPPSQVAIDLVDGTTIQVTDQQISLAALDLPFTPAINDRITFNAVEFRVQAIRPVYAGNAVCLWKLVCRK